MFFFFIFCIPCLLLLLYFGILAIFVPSKRHYVKDAWHCFTRKLLMRPCDVEFDKQMKARFSAWLAAKGHPRAGAFVFKHFETMMTVLFAILFIVSIYATYLFWEWIVVGNKPCAPDGGSTICLGNFTK